MFTIWRRFTDQIETGLGFLRAWLLGPVEAPEVTAIREAILADCAASLLAINGAGSYHHALLAVTRGRATPEALAALPAAFLEPGDERISQETNWLLTRFLSVRVEAWVRSLSGNLPTVANRMLADLERALTAHPTRGGLAIWTRMTGNSILQDDAPGILVSVRATFEVRYMTIVGDPIHAG